MVLPTFVIIGAQKSGTRWLRQNLGAHRSVFTVNHEVEFFNHHYDEGLDWYRAQFDGWSGEPVVGEATPGYMFQVDDPNLAAQRMADSLGPGVAIVAILRDPVERVRSSYLHHLRRDRIDPDVDPLRFLKDLDPDIDELGIVSGCWYGRGLQPFAERFERLHIEFHSDIAHDAESLYVRVLTHVGVDDPWVPAALHEVVFSGRAQVAKRFPDHAILTVSGEAIADAIGSRLFEDGELLEQTVGRAVPWLGAHRAIEEATA